MREFADNKPVFGTCAGAILVAKEVSNPVQESLGVMDIAVERNAYGRQLDSRIVHLQPEGMDGGDLEAVFIRAPIIRKVGEGARVLARYNGDPVLVEQGRHVVATFHPELTGDTEFTNCSSVKSKVSDRKRVLFLCIGNICRSPMAEAFARKYGSRRD